MTRDEFDAFVKRLEKISQANPRCYTARVVGLMALAYGYLALVLLGSLAIIIALIALVINAPNGATIKLAFIGVIAAGGVFTAVARGLWVKLTPPTGQVIACAQAPKLFALLDELRAALDCRPFHQVLLIGDLNAAVVQTPRLGVFGWHRNYLLIGLPLMQSLAPDEFKAVLAHEFAHSSRGHGRFGNWLYRLRRSWQQIFEQMARQRSRLGFVLTKFVNWFWPIFNAHAFVLARANEYEADACSVRLASADAAARALMRLRVDGHLLEEKFWPDIFARATQEKESPSEIWLALGRALRAGPPTEDAARWMRQAFLIQTNNSDTHPCLKERLQAIVSFSERGQLEKNPATSPAADLHPSLKARLQAVAQLLTEKNRENMFIEPPAPPTETAAEFFLGAHLETAARQMSEDWRKAIARQWAERYEHTKKLAAELAEIEKPADAAPPTTEQLWAKARKLIELQGDKAAVPVVDQVLALDPNHAGANFVRGRNYLEADDPRGVTLLETAIASDPALTREACGLLYGHFSRTGQREKLRPIEDRVDKFQKTAALAQAERARVTVSDSFIFHGLTGRQIAELRKVFEAEPEIISAAAACKALRHFPKLPCYVIALRLKLSVWKLRSTAANQQLVHRVITQVKLPGNFLVFVDEGNLKNLAKKIFTVPDATIFLRPPKN